MEYGFNHIQPNLLIDESSQRQSDFLHLQQKIGDELEGLEVILRDRQLLGKKQ